MERAGEFEKVSFGQFAAALADSGRGEEAEELYQALRLPERATRGSAGYDFHAPFAFSLEPGAEITIPTGVRVRIEPGWWLGILPRSGLGFRYRLQLNNTMGVIDSDYYESDNEGHIFIRMTNCGEKALTLTAGQGFAQGIFLPYGITWSDAAEARRNGGMGSTD